MRFGFLTVVAGALLLAACGTTTDEVTPVAATQAPPTADQQASGRDVTSTAVGVARPGSQEHLNQTIGDRVFFDFDRHELSPEARRTVESWAEWLKSYPNVAATIEGHADERGTREYNLALGERRAVAVRDYLTALGVGSGRLRTISYGKERPAVLGSNEAAWGQNRRSVLVVQ